MCIKQFNLPFIQKSTENHKRHYLRDASPKRASKALLMTAFQQWKI